MARPVVATPEIFAGVCATAGRDILLACEVDDTVRSIIDVLGGRHATLGAAGRSAVAAPHRWRLTLRLLDRLFGEVTDMPERSPAGRLSAGHLPTGQLPTGQAA